MNTNQNEEVLLNAKRYIVSKTDTKGNITYANDYFVEICGYSSKELIGKPHNIIRHPDMPKVIFKLMWQRIQSGQNIMAIVKNQTKDGRYYWVITDFEAKKDKLTNEIISYSAFRKAAPRDAIDAIIPIYKKLLEFEKIGDMKVSEKYLLSYLEDKNLSYDEFIDKLVKNTGLFKLFFTAMKKIFG